MDGLNARLRASIEKRTCSGLLRTLADKSHLIDFSSNDYLGLARDERHLALIQASTHQHGGSTGSRLLSGEREFTTIVEQQISSYHQVEAALLYSSGFMANIGLLGTLIRPADHVLFDSLSHSSIRVGLELSRASTQEFKHNNLTDLKHKLNSRDQSKQLFVVIESIYSMDGDEARLEEIVELCRQHNAHLIVDEAHSIGVSGHKGEGLIRKHRLTDSIFAQVVTYGKAMGTHGAAVLGSLLLKDYLLNFSKSQIYTTAPSLHTVATIQAAYKALETRNDLHERLRKNKQLFESLTGIQSPSAIYSILVPGNEEVLHASAKLEEHGFDVRPIRYPTVARGKERLRVNIHAHNTNQEINDLVKSLVSDCRITFDA